MTAVAWPFLPVSYSEVLSFLTSVRKAPAGEWRDSNRNAVQHITLTYTVEDATAAKLAEAFRAHPVGTWYVPLWNDHTVVSGTAAAGSTTINAETNADYRAGGKAMLHDSDDVYEIVDVASAAAGVVTLANPTASSHTDFTICPVLECIPATSLSRSAQRFIDNPSIEFIATTQVDLAASSYPTLNGFDIINDPLSDVSPLDGGVGQLFQMVDSQLGSMELITVENYVRPRWTVQFQDYTAATRWARKQWIYKVRGRDGAFWLPTWKEDLTLTAPIGAADTTCTVTDIMPSATAYANRAIQLEDTDGSLYHLIITSAVVAAGVATLTIPAIGSAVTQNAKVSFMDLMRLDNDDVQIDYEPIMGDMMATIVCPAVGVQA